MTDTPVHVTTESWLEALFTFALKPSRSAHPLWPLYVTVDAFVTAIPPSTVGRIDRAGGLIWSGDAYHATFGVDDRVLTCRLTAPAVHMDVAIRHVQDRMSGRILQISAPMADAIAVLKTLQSDWRTISRIADRLARSKEYGRR